MAADSSTLADEYITSPHRDSNGTEHRLNIEHVEEITLVMADNVDATVPVRPAPTPMSKCETQFWNIVAFMGLPDTKENLNRVALEDWTSSFDTLEELMEKRGKEIRSIRKEIYQVVGFYSAFQGLLLTAIAQSNLLHWNNRAYPLALSAFATTIAAIGVVLKNNFITDLKETLAKEYPALKALVHRVQRLRIEGIKFPFQDVYEEECKVIHPQTKLDRLYSLLFNYETLVVATLIAFGVLFVVSLLQILRHPDIPTQ